MTNSTTPNTAEQTTLSATQDHNVIPHVAYDSKVNRGRAAIDCRLDSWSVRLRREEGGSGR